MAEESMAKSWRAWRKYYAWRMAYFMLRGIEHLVDWWLELKALITREPVIGRRPPLKPLSADSLLLRPAHELSLQIRSGKVSLNGVIVMTRKPVLT